MEISAAAFRANCFKIMDRLQTTRGEVVITKRGKPIAKLIPIVRSENKKDPLLGALAGTGRTIADLTQPVADDEDWEID